MTVVVFHVGDWLAFVFKGNDEHEANTVREMHTHSITFRTV
jgi:hypothetical protein